MCIESVPLYLNQIILRWQVNGPIVSVRNCLPYHTQCHRYNNRYWLLNLSSQHASSMMCQKRWSQCKQSFSLSEQAVCLKKGYGILSVNKVCQRKRQTAPLKQSEECWLHWVSEPVSSIPWQHWEISWLMWKTLYLIRRRTVWCAGSPVVTAQPLTLARLEGHWSTA